MGSLQHLRQNTCVDQAAMVLAMLGISLPSFYLGLLMIIVFAVDPALAAHRRLHRVDRRPDWLARHIDDAGDFPGTCCSPACWRGSPRSTMLEVLRQDYIRTARAKGLPNHTVVVKHALANALIPIVTVVGIIVSLLISGSVVVETLFSIPGIGQLLTQAVLNRDYPMVQGGLLIITTLLGGGEYRASTVCYALLDPRVRYDRTHSRASPFRTTMRRLLHHRLFVLGCVLFGTDFARLRLPRRLFPASIQISCRCARNSILQGLTSSSARTISAVQFVVPCGLGRATFGVHRRRQWWRSMPSWARPSVPRPATFAASTTD